MKHKFETIGLGICIINTLAISVINVAFVTHVQ
jgi:hypothetical protein